MNTGNLKCHLIDQYSIFGEYKQPENRVTCALLHIINYCGSEFIDKLIDAFGGDPVSSQPLVATQMLLKRNDQVVKSGNDQNCCVDGIVACDYNFKIYIESKIKCKSINEDQLNAYRNVLTLNSNEYLLYITPDAEKPSPLDARDYWMNWDEINNLLEDFAKFKNDNLLDFLVKQFQLLTQNLVGNKRNKINSNKEKVDLEKRALQKLQDSTFVFDASKNSEEQVLIVGGRWGEKIAVEFEFYACQPNRYFFPTKYLAFYYDNRIKYLFEIIEEPRTIPDISDSKLGIDKRYFNEYDKDYRNSQNKAREFFKLRLVKVFKDDGIKNDQKDKNGRPCAFVQRQRYTTIQKIVNAEFTSQL